MRHSWFASLMALALISTPTPAFPQTPQIPNLDFEQGTADSLPPTWRAASAIARGFQVTTTDHSPHGGRFAGLIRRDTLLYISDPGGLSKKIDARPYRGHRVRLSGWLRYESSRGIGSANLYLRVYGEGGSDRFAVATDQEAVRTGEWVERQISGEVAADADSISFGAFLDREGLAYVDDVSLTLLGPSGEGDQPPRSLTRRGEQNLVALARLLGYVRHFHPSDESATADWDRFAITAVDEVESARTPAELAATLERLFRPIAPTVRVADRPLPQLDVASLLPPGARPACTTGWWHHGWGGGVPPSVYYDRRPRNPIGAVSDSVAPIGAEVNRSLGGGVWCSVPLSLYADSTGTLPRGTLAARQWQRPEGWLPSGGDRATRLADVILFWNIPQHFYPYFDVVGTDWLAQLIPTLRSAARDRDGASFETTLHRLVAKLHDGHGSVTSPSSDFTPMPLAWSFVGDRLVVTRVDSTLAGRIRPGDEVVTIAGRRVAEWADQARAIKSAATPQFLRLRVSQALQVLPGTDSVGLGLRSPEGRAYRETVLRQGRDWLIPPRPDSITMLRPGVMYVDLHRITDADFLRALPSLVDAKGVIFDLRGYPWRISTRVLAHLTDTTLTCAQWHIPIVTRPDREDMTFDFSNWPVLPQAPRIRARAAFLIDGSAISYAETYLGMVEHYRLAELVGESTAGTNGNIVTTRLPGKYDVVFTGMKVLKHDGSRHQGVGILPTVPVSPTIAGIAAGRDEQLEKAIEVVSR
jgi:C-terminal processing protease CtpA/Prc